MRRIIVVSGLFLFLCSNANAGSILYEFFGTAFHSDYGSRSFNGSFIADPEIAHSDAYNLKLIIDGVGGFGASNGFKDVSPDGDRIFGQFIGDCMDGSIDGIGTMFELLLSINGINDPAGDMKGMLWLEGGGGDGAGGYGYSPFEGNINCVNMSPVPEPATIFSIGIGILGLAVSRKKFEK